MVTAKILNHTRWECKYHLVWIPDIRGFLLSSNFGVDPFSLLDLNTLTRKHQYQEHYRIALSHHLIFYTAKRYRRLLQFKELAKLQVPGIIVN